MSKAGQILFLSFLSGLLFGCKEKYPDLSLTAEQDEPDYMVEVRASRIYEIIGKGLLILFHKAQRGDVDLMGKPDRLFLFFVLKKRSF